MNPSVFDGSSRRAVRTIKHEISLNNSNCHYSSNYHYFRGTTLQAYASLVSNRSCWIAEKLDSNTQQTLATRAFKASERILFGKAKKVRFKVPSRFRSMEDKTNKQGLRWKDGMLCGFPSNCVL